MTSPSAHAVIGANYGDEGKGLATDWLCALFGADVVVRFNGGAQAGHTVVTPAGERHVFHHIGSGTFAGAATFLSRHFVCNPILFNQEWPTFGRYRVPIVMADPACLVTTPGDMVVNQAIEKARGASAHGSCGVGFNETIERSQHDAFRVTASMLLDPYRLERTLRAIREEYWPNRVAELGLAPGVAKGLNFIPNFLDDCRRFLRRVDVVPPFVLRDAHHIVFEGAQGLMLDQNNRTDFPHLTRSNTGLQNVMEIAGELGLEHVQPVYVTRPYLTRHGAGPLPGEMPTPPFPGIRDETNVAHPFQGTLRFAPIDVEALRQRIEHDAARAGDVRPTLFVTCTDHVGRGRMAFTGDERVSAEAELIERGIEGFDFIRSAGPTRADVTDGPR